ncbi:hypothetical protein [Hyphomicrobium sp.]|uniref:hypothetical protein n=1 Tax=Hyphomicrobium sp. TaxID=82 RepID=UPI002E381AF2|nr:hypothetical protein [Hyphomicrobium sp.]HEX2843167.1 hypothetical protein [Hyphomicrobium sp.]
MQLKLLRLGWGHAAFLAALLLTGLGAVAASRDEVRSSSGIRLIMVEEPGCRFCRQWDAEIGGGYRKTSEGRFAPLKRVRREDPEVKGLAPIVYTPTFVVMRSGEELGRITGYPGADYFYEELRPILAAAGFFPGL